MADREIIALNESVSRIEAAQMGDRYVARVPILAEEGVVIPSGQLVGPLDPEWAKDILDNLSVSGPIDLDALAGVNAALATTMSIIGYWDATSGAFPAVSHRGDAFIVNTTGSLGGTDYYAGDLIIALVDSPVAVDPFEWFRLRGFDRVISVAGRTGNVVLTLADIAGAEGFLLPEDIDSLAKLKVLSNADLDETTDPRDPTAHTHTDAVNAGVTAYAGGGQTNAVALLVGLNILDTVVTDGDSVKLPTAVAGEEVKVVNIGAKHADVFPFLDDKIDTQAVNTAFAVAPNSSITLQAIDAITWRIMSPQTTGWKDLEMQIVGAASGPAAPSATAFGPSGNIKMSSFGVNDSVYLTGHVPHDIKPGSTMYFHVHWSTNGTSVNTVKWEINWTAAKGHQQEAFPAETALSVEAAGYGTAWWHMITEDAVGIAAPEVDSLFLVELKRVTNGGVENANTVFALYVDLHYESQQNATPKRVPDFYT